MFRFTSTPRELHTYCKSRAIQEKRNALTLPDVVGGESYPLLYIDYRLSVEYYLTMYDKIIKEVLENGAKKATHFISNKEIIRVVRTSYGGKFHRGNLELTITRGKPNYAEREIAKKLGEHIKKMTHFKYLPEKKKQPTRKGRTAITTP